MRPIRLVVADVDGTLVTHDKVLTPRACEAVDRLRGAGIQLAITSGRPPRGMAMLMPATPNISTSVGMSPMAAISSRGTWRKREAKRTTMPLFASGCVTSR